MADEKDTKDQAVADAKAEEASSEDQKVVRDPAGPTTDPANRAPLDQRGDGKPKKAEKVADEEASKNQVDRSVGAKAIVALEQNPDLSSNQDKAKTSEQAYHAENDDVTLLVYHCGDRVRLGQFWTLEANGRTYVFEEDKGIPVQSRDVKDILKQADANDYYTITKA